MASKLRNEGKLFIPTISGPNEYAKLLSQSDFSEIALLKAQVQSLEESICALENDSIVTYPHPEAERPGQSSLPIALYSYRRKLFHTILAGTRQAKEAKSKIAELQRQHWHSQSRSRRRRSSSKKQMPRLVSRRYSSRMLSSARRQSRRQ